MTQHTTNTSKFNGCPCTTCTKVTISDIVSPTMSPQADAAVQGAMERAAEAMDKVANSNADELADLRDYIERSYQGALEADGLSYSGAARVSFADYVMSRFMSWHKRELRDTLPKAKVVEAIDELLAELPVKEGEVIQVEYGTTEQLNKAFANIQDNGMLMGLKSIKRKLGLGE